MGGDGGVKDTPLYERWRGMGWGVKVSYWQNGQNGQNRPSLPSSHPWPVSPQSTLGWIFPEKPLLESFTWKAVLEESFGFCREIAQLVPHSFPPSYKYKYTSIQTQMREIQQLICVIHRPLTNTNTNTMRSNNAMIRRVVSHLLINTNQRNTAVDLRNSPSSYKYFDTGA